MKRNWKHIIWQTFSWLIILAIFFISLGFSEQQRKNEICQSIEVRILDSTTHHFLKAKNILSILNDKNFKIIGQPINQLPLNDIETVLSKNTFIYKIETYTTLESKLFIDIYQRKPMLRIINYNNESYYIDKEGVLFPLSENYTDRVLIVSGNINEPYALYCNKKAYEAEQQDILKRKTILDDIFYLAHNIYNDSLWNSLFEQIYVNENTEFELIPKLGDFIIEFGDTSHLQIKFNKLKAFYKEVVPKLSGNEFLKINLKYKNQIVCTKKQSNI